MELQMDFLSSASRRSSSLSIISLELALKRFYKIHYFINFIANLICWDLNPESGRSSSYSSLSSSSARCLSSRFSFSRKFFSSSNFASSSSNLLMTAFHFFSLLLRSLSILSALILLSLQLVQFAEYFASLAA